MPGRGLLPRLAEIVRAVEVRAEIVLFVTVHGGVGGAGVEVRRLQHADLRERCQARRRDILPGGAAVARELDHAVVGAGPDLAGRHRRGREGVDGRAIRWARWSPAAPARAAGRALPEWLPRVGRRLRARRSARFVRSGLMAFQCTPPSLRLQQELRAHVQGVRILRRKAQRRIGGHAVFRVAAHHARRHGGHLPVGAVDAHHAAARPAGVHQVVVQRIGNNVAELVAAHRVPVHEGDLAVVAAAQRAHRPAVLLRAVDPVGIAIVGGEMIDLAGRLVVPGTPRFCRRPC